MKDYETKNHRRILDYYDNHVYPWAEGVFSENSDPATNARRLRSTQSLWNPTYIDESWIGTGNLEQQYKSIHFIPRMKKMIEENYPGTKLAITEYNYGAVKTITGALVQVDVLGIYGREGEYDSWQDRKNRPWIQAFRMYLNYDGKGSKFGDISVSAKSSDETKISIFASIRSSDKSLLIMVVNKDPNEKIGQWINIAGFNYSSNVTKVFRYSQQNLNQIVQMPDSYLNVDSRKGWFEFPPYSITLIVIEK
jgi:hypothetical protein